MNGLWSKSPAPWLRHAPVLDWDWLKLQYSAGEEIRHIQNHTGPNRPERDQTEGFGDKEISNLSQF